MRQPSDNLDALVERVLVALEKRHGQQLLSGTEVAGRLGIAGKTFHCLEPRLIAAGLKRVLVPGRGTRPTCMYTLESLDRIITRAANRGEPLCA